MLAPLLAKSQSWERCGRRCPLLAALLPLSLPTNHHLRPPVTAFLLQAPLTTNCIAGPDRHDRASCTQWLRCCSSKLHLCCEGATVKAVTVACNWGWRRQSYATAPHAVMSGPFAGALRTRAHLSTTTFQPCRNARTHSSSHARRLPSSSWLTCRQLPRATRRRAR